MKTIVSPSITNPGIAFTDNTFSILGRIVDRFMKIDYADVPYKKFQEMYCEVDATGDSKIRMLFPLLRRCGCIQSTSPDSVLIHNGSFLTQLGSTFYTAGKIMFDIREKNEELQQKGFTKNHDLERQAVDLFQAIAKVVAENLMESDATYRHLMNFVEDFSPVTKDEVLILFYSLNKHSANPGHLEHSKYDKAEVKNLINAYRQRKIEVKQEGNNNAAQYFLNVLNTLHLICKKKDGFYRS